MFVTQFSDHFRQGDVISKIFFTSPCFYVLKDNKLTLQPNTILREAYFVLVSQCCDLQWHADTNGNNIPRRAFITVAPLSLKLPFDKNTIEYNKMIENGINQPDNDPIQYYFYQNNSYIGQESVVDFSTLIPIRSALLKEMKVKKLLELDKLHRHLFRTRLREYFSRIPQEDWDVAKDVFPSDSA